MCACVCVCGGGGGGGGGGWGVVSEQVREYASESVSNIQCTSHLPYPPVLKS